MKKFLFSVVMVVVLLIWVEASKAPAAPPVNTTTSPVYSLTAPGDFPAISTKGYNWVTFVFWDSLAVTSATVQFMGGLSGRTPISYGNIDADDDSLVLAGTHGNWYRKFNCAALDYVFLRVLSEAGGTTGLYKCVYKLENTEK